MGAFVPSGIALPFLQGAADRIGISIEVTEENREQVEEILSEQVSK